MQLGEIIEYRPKQTSNEDGTIMRVVYWGLPEGITQLVQCSTSPENYVSMFGQDALDSWIEASK